MKRSVDPDSVAFVSAASPVPAGIKILANITVNNQIIATVVVVLLWFLGIPNPILWGIVAFVCGFIPYIGYWISVLPPMVLGFAQSGIPGALAVLLGYWLINGVLSSVVAPRYFGKGLNVSPVLALLAVLFWGWLLGPVGAVVGVPMTVLLKMIVLVNYPETRWLAQVLSQDDGDSEPELPVSDLQT
jgi:AI-2 transport protein TqsA